MEINSIDDFTADYSLTSAITPELPTWDIGTGQSDTYINADIPSPAPTGGGFGGDLLNTIKASADSFLNFAQKIYSIENAADSARFARTVRQSELELARQNVTGQIDVNRARTEAQRQIEIARANAATAQAQRLTNSSGAASYLNMPASIPWPLILIGGAAAVYFLTRGK